MSIVNEVWGDIPNYEGLYQVSNQGRVRSCDRVAPRKTNGDIHLKGAILKLGKCRNGYMRVGLSEFGERKSMAVHRLVALVFIGKPKEESQVNHIDGVKSNNCVSNLEYCTPSENTQHAYKTGLCNSSIGVNRQSSKLVDKDIPVIRQRLANGETQRSIAKDYGVSGISILRIKNGRNWKHIK
jgi:hypothetical protein